MGTQQEFGALGLLSFGDELLSIGKELGDKLFLSVVEALAGPDIIRGVRASSMSTESTSSTIA